MSPEQARGRRTDARSGIFSTGVVFYELLCGRKPFLGEDYFETMEKVRSEDPRPLAELVAGLPLPLVRAVERSLAKDPAVRYQTLEDLRVELLGMPDVTPADTAAEGLRDAVERKFSEVVRLHRTLVAAIGASALGEETLPIADPVAEGRAAGAGLETVLHDLESQTERLRALARTVGRVEPRVARGIAAFEHGAFAEAVAELDAVLREIPQHQRARDYRERARLEKIRERTVRSVGAGSVVSAPRDARVGGAAGRPRGRGGDRGGDASAPPGDPRAADGRGHPAHAGRVGHARPAPPGRRRARRGRQRRRLPLPAVEPAAGGRPGPGRRTRAGAETRARPEPGDHPRRRRCRRRRRRRGADTAGPVPAGPGSGAGGRESAPRLAAPAKAAPPRRAKAARPRPADLRGRQGRRGRPHLAQLFRGRGTTNGPCASTAACSPSIPTTPRHGRVSPRSRRN
jgi:hypothetical protein